MLHTTNLHLAAVQAVFNYVWGGLLDCRAISDFKGTASAVVLVGVDTAGVLISVAARVPTSTQVIWV